MIQWNSGNIPESLWMKDQSFVSPNLEMISLTHSEGLIVLWMKLQKFSGAMVGLQAFHFQNKSFCFWPPTLHTSLPCFEWWSLGILSQEIKAFKILNQRSFCFGWLKEKEIVSTECKKRLPTYLESLFCFSFYPNNCMIRCSVAR